MLPGFKFSSLSDKGDLMPVRCVPVPKEVAADDLRCVGSFHGWLVGVTPNKDRSDEYNRDADGDCFLVNVFSRKVIRLPQLCHMRYNFPAYSSKTLRIINGSGEVYFRVNDIYTMSLCNVALSASPDSRGKYIVAASSDHKCASKLALWQPGMIYGIFALALTLMAQEISLFTLGSCMCSKDIRYASLLLKLGRTMVGSWSLALSVV